MYPYSARKLNQNECVPQSMFLQPLPGSDRLECQRNTNIRNKLNTSNSICVIVDYQKSWLHQIHKTKQTE